MNQVKSGAAAIASLVAVLSICFNSHPALAAGGEHQAAAAQPGTDDRELNAKIAALERELQSVSAEKTRVGMRLEVLNFIDLRDHPINMTDPHVRMQFYLTSTPPKSLKERERFDVLVEKTMALEVELEHSRNLKGQKTPVDMQSQAEALAAIRARHFASAQEEDAFYSERWFRFFRDNLMREIESNQKLRAEEDRKLQDLVKLREPGLVPTPDELEQRRFLQGFDELIRAKEERLRWWKDTERQIAPTELPAVQKP
jgi:outer membrane murein-binding lipoprotein Lpp